MTRHGGAWLGRHSTLTVQCTYCARIAVFHWNTTYPEVLLCEYCLDLYPEVDTGLELPLQNNTEKNSPSGQAG